MTLEENRFLEAHFQGCPNARGQNQQAKITILYVVSHFPVVKCQKQSWGNDVLLKSPVWSSRSPYLTPASSGLTASQSWTLLSRIMLHFHTCVGKNNRPAQDRLQTLEFLPAHLNTRRQFSRTNQFLLKLSPFLEKRKVGGKNWNGTRDLEQITWYHAISISFSVNNCQWSLTFLAIVILH